MLSKLALFPVVFTMFYITYFVIYFLWREYSIAKKMLSISAARKCLQKKIFPFGLVAILIMSVALLICFCFSEEFNYIIIFNIFFLSWFFMMLIDFLFSRHSSKKSIFVCIDKQEKERNFFGFLAFTSLFILFTFNRLNQNSSIRISDFYFNAMYLYVGIHYLVLIFNKLKVVEKGIIYKFRLIKWNNICAYKNISDSLDWDRNSVFKITLRVKPSILHMSSFVQIPVNPQDIDSINQILVERLPGKNL
jgi:hypothetical protein